MIRPALTSIVVLVLCGASLAAQTKTTPGKPAATKAGQAEVDQKRPDFSGRWVTQTKEGVKQQVVTIDDKSLTIQIGGRTTTYQLDGVERRMPLPPGGGSIGARMTMMGSARWDGNRLLIAAKYLYPDGGQQQFKDVWSMDAQGRLVIDTTSIGPDGKSDTSRAIFTKKP
ncbi:MAG TPA: hypothetical protein VFV78_07655 [Vicinamibacterales bacterium]|nr:hypothetical protein [Vicinamibacterales bacterium]